MFTNTKYDDTKTKNKKTERETDRQAGRQADRQTGRQTDRQTVFGLTCLWPGLTSRSPHRHLSATCGNGHSLSVVNADT